MELKHVALVSRTEQDADLFFGQILGLTREPVKVLPADVSGPLFGIYGGLAVINYSGKGMRFEIFITDEQLPALKPVAHVCLEVPGREAFLDRCGELGFEVLRLPKGEREITFVKDNAGNLFEIK